MPIENVSASLGSLFTLNKYWFNKLKILRKIEDAAGLVTKSCLTIGNFDGCHLGHQKLLGLTLSHKERISGESIAITFIPNPKHYFKAPERNTSLFTPGMKRDYFSSSGFDYLIEQPFDESFSQVTHREFLELIQKLNPYSITVGDNFQFGYLRQGNCLVLSEFCNKEGIVLDTVKQMKHKRHGISSSRIRELLLKGDVQQASELLGRPHTIVGMVSDGRKEGRKLGFPTANLRNLSQLVPLNGVYCGYAMTNDSCCLWMNRLVPLML